MLKKEPRLSKANKIILHQWIKHDMNALIAVKIPEDYFLVFFVTIAHYLTTATTDGKNTGANPE